METSSRRSWGGGLLFVVGVVVGVVACLLVVSSGLVEPPAATTGQWGSFVAEPTVKLLGDGRLIQLIDDFVYIDPRGKPWTAPKGTVADGASIPQPFWTFTGGPLNGQFRNASIVHDFECERRRQPSQDVHLMFYEACRCGGVPENQAKVLFAAVYHFGPKWELESRMQMRSIEVAEGEPEAVPVEVTVGVPLDVDAPNTADVEKLQQYVTENNPTIEQLMAVDPATLQ